METNSETHGSTFHLWQTLSRRPVGVNAIAWSFDGRTIAAGTNYGSIRLWDVSSSSLASEFQAHSGHISAMAWSPSHGVLATGATDGAIRLWEAGHSELISELKINGYIGALCWSPDGRLLAFGVGNRFVEVWDYAGHTSFRLPREHKAFIGSLAWSPDGNILASGANNGTLRLWNVKAKSRYLTLQGHRTPIRGLAWSPDGRVLASGAENGLIRFWNPKTGESSDKVKTNSISSLAWSLDGETIASAANDGAMRFWDSEYFRIRRRPRGHKSPINTIMYSPDGSVIASGGADDAINLWDADTGKLQKTLSTNNYIVTSLAWSSDRSILATGAGDSKIRLWNSKTGALVRLIEGHNNFIQSLAWHPDGHILASSANDGYSVIWDVDSGKQLYRFNQYYAPNQLAWSKDGKTLAIGEYSGRVKVFNLNNAHLRNLHVKPWVGIHSLAWAPNSYFLACGTKDGEILVLDIRGGNNPKTFKKGHSSSVVSIAWSPEGLLLASASVEGIIGIWDVADNLLLRTLEGHSSYVRDLSWSPDGRILVSVSVDGSIFVWETDTWQLISQLNRQSKDLLTHEVSFQSAPPHREFLGDQDAVINNIEIDIDKLLSSAVAIESLQYTSAKIVLVGESNVGKSSLAFRLSEWYYEEQGTTHGMRIWPMAPDQLDPDTLIPEGEIRDILVWDMGGQDEYRLVHQLFLRDTTLALILLDPTRGRTAFEEVEGWNLRLEKQLHGQGTVKILVGTKLDEESTTIDQYNLDRVISDCGFIGYYPTSAKTDRGVTELRAAISRALNWATLTKTSRTTLFQRIRDEIERRQRDGEIVVLCSEIEEYIRHKYPDDYDPKAVNSVVEQLALQGMIADTQLASEERVLVLQIGEIERYAGSLIIAARNNPRGVPAIEEQIITSAKLVFPGIKEEERLHRFNERIVLECVVQLLLEHGVCLRHEGLLIFPSLFQPAEKENVAIHHSISLYYDFSGAIDNIYSSLVVQLALSERFGRVRLWDDKAEYEIAGKGLCGLRKVGHRSGLAHLDLFFSNQTPEETRGLFTVFVEEHLRKEGVRITEVLEVTCSCGYRFQETSLRKRFAEGRTNIICPECETRTRISEGAERTRSSNPEVEEELLALKTIIDNRSKEVVVEAKQAFDVIEDNSNITTPLRVLHLSDLHISSTADVISLLQPLIQDIEDPEGGIAANHLDYLVVSGDLTNRATAEEFEQVHQFISELISYFKLTAERCIIVPGNHDLSWDQQVYDWKQQRLVEISSLREGMYHQQGDVFLIRNDEWYPSRFENFAKFYHALLQQQYPLKAEDQCIPTLFEETRIQFIAMNSSWEIDEFFPARSGINESALSRGLVKADEQIRRAKETGLLSSDEDVMRIAVWHHPVTGNEKIVNDAFIDRLWRAGARLSLHGHVHEERADVVKYTHPKRVHVIGGGSFGAPSKDRPESVPRLYNIIEVERDLSLVRVHTRSLRKEGGAWEGWAVWPGSSPNERLTYYEIKF